MPNLSSAFFSGVRAGFNTNYYNDRCKLTIETLPTDRPLRFTCSSPLLLVLLTRTSESSKIRVSWVRLIPGKLCLFVGQRRRLVNRADLEYLWVEYNHNDCL